MLTEPDFSRHSLRGLCGLKYFKQLGILYGPMSQPARAVWIEIFVVRQFPVLLIVTACEGCVD